MDHTPTLASAAPGLTMDLHEHGICWVLPLGAQITAAVIDLPGGALIQGELTGRIVCRSGSLIIADTGSLTGHGEANRVYVDGEIRACANGDPSTLRGHQLVAVSERAQGGADLVAQAFSIHTQTFSARFTTLERS